MRFWDSSALVPLVVEEPATELVVGCLESAVAADLLVWWGTAVELQSALARRAREGEMTDSEAARAREALVRLRRSWQEISPSGAIQARAERLLHAHPLRAADSLQLAAAAEARNRMPSVEFVCLDDRLSQAAAREGFSVLP